MVIMTWIGLMFTSLLFYCGSWLLRTFHWQILIPQFDAHVGGMNDIAFSHLGKQSYIITCGDDNTIEVI